MLPRFGKLCPSVRQAFRSPGSIVRVSDRPSAAQEASSECPTGLPRFRKHRPSVRQAFRGPGSIVRASDSPSAAQEASSECPTGLPRPRKHRRSARQAFRGPGSIVELFPLDNFRRILMGGTPDTSSGTKSDKQSQD